MKKNLGLLKRIPDMLDMYCNQKKTLREIGEKYQVTSERIRQILHQFPEYRNQKTHNSSKKHYTFTCPMCKQQKTVTPSQMKKKFCNAKCEKEYTRIKWKSFKEKKCSNCGKIKPRTDFYFSPEGKPQAHCKKCHNGYTMKWKKNHKEQAKIINKKAYYKWYNKNKKTTKIQQRNNRSN